MRAKLHKHKLKKPAPVNLPGYKTYVNTFNKVQLKAKIWYYKA